MAGCFFLKKYLLESVENTMSEPLDFKIFRGEDAPRAPYKLAPPALLLAPLPLKYTLPFLCQREL